MNYFKNRDESRRHAQIHTKEMEERFKSEIEYSVAHSEILDITNDKLIIPTFPTTDLQYVTVGNMTTDYAVFAHKELLEADGRNPGEAYGTKIAVLNFASFKNPGGMFIDGSMAQEESLCHVSFLYNILSRFRESFYTPNTKMLNRSLYANRGIYTPDIHFVRKTYDGLEQHTVADVFTISAPNARAARKHGVQRQEIYYELRKRIRFVIQSMLDHGPYGLVILGAFGCGVFGNDPQTVATLFFKELDNMECRIKFFKVIFAIIGDGNDHIFNNILEDRRKIWGPPLGASLDFDDSPPWYVPGYMRIDPSSADKK